MTKSLNEMTVTEAASLALEILIYGEWDNQANKSWITAREGEFKDFLLDYLFGDEEEVYDEETENYVPVSEISIPSLDNQRVWQSLHSEGKQGTRDGFTAKVEKSHGGEGEGDQFWMVISITDGLTTRYFRKDGWYASYDGGYLDGDTYEVKPQERTVVFYE